MTNTTHNGWTNYATWRVNLEMFDGFNPYERFDFFDPNQVYELGNDLKEYARDMIEDTAGEGLARDYALAFLDDVNWREIAQHMIADYADKTETN
jgi:hypothetical protein